jgi:hypothetical protein
MLLLASASRAAADEEPAPERAGIYGEMLAGAGSIDSAAVEPGIVAGQVGRLSSAFTDALLRFGMRGASGLGAIAEGRAGAIFGVTGASHTVFTTGALAGVQWNWQLSGLSPYLNARGGMRIDNGNARGTLALGFGLEVSPGRRALVFEFSAEPLSPAAFAVRVGAMTF